MTLLTASQQMLIDCLKAQGGRADSVYDLAAKLGRPYRRVFDQVKMLAAQGRLVLSPGQEGRRRKTSIALADPGAEAPELTFNRIWSTPPEALPETTLIASVLAQPTFDDVLGLALHYGLPKVRQIFLTMVAAGDLEGWALKESARTLANVEDGFIRAT
ncbi:hypothetical protein D0B54_01745 [Solimonas sp. K1W22B-7]|uniref:hypothetical protein n=1 Tax=Solimonas sp. K1W22B-7 TaxID=2303331 RepID=UPI000E3379E8|nr:hypothetical protein [Solimonas sp. K1W22B-7]AXQ27482.1 hypothetical protein D0B54_01745 [Solimonas sp. K1W22B-7]